MGRELLVLRGSVEAAPHEVADVLLDVRQGGRSPLVPPGRVSDVRADGGRTVTTFEVEGSAVTVDVDPAGLRAGVQGRWWYRGEWDIAPARSGSQLTYRILDVAGQGRWAVRFVARTPVRAAPAEFGALLDALGRELGCDAHPLD